MSVLVTGAAGFIGSHVCKRLIDDGKQVIGVDNLNSYYSVELKKDRLARLESLNFKFIYQDIADIDGMNKLFADHDISQVVHLAAEAGVQYGTEQPALFINSNVVGFGHVLENCRKHQIKHLVYASTAAVYGDQSEWPLKESCNTDHPLTLYAATKKANEVLAYSYSHLYGLACTGLRFFTAYGPWGRPDMALYKFAQRINEGLPIEINNAGDHSRDLIYIDDLVDAIIAVLSHTPDNEKTNPPHQIYNLGSHQVVGLLDMVKMIEQQLGQSTPHVYLPLQPGDIKNSLADNSVFREKFGIEPKVPFADGLVLFLNWFRAYHQTG